MDIGDDSSLTSTKKSMAAFDLVDSYVNDSKRHNSVTSNNSNYEIVGYKDGKFTNCIIWLEKVYKKYKISNLVAIIILTSIAVDSNYLRLPYPFILSPPTSNID